MPTTNISTFKVRHYECDAYGHLNHANYLRYMQEAAFDASAAAGYPKERYESMGYLWLARETDIEYFKPLFYGDTIEIKTWVEDFRRVRSIRRYEIHKADELVARASTDWVYIHRDTARPSVVPPEIIAAFSNDEPVGVAGPRESFPIAPPPPPGAFKMRRRVEWRDIDTAYHVNNAVYFNYVEDCGIQAVAQFGWPITRMQENGFGIFARRERIQYRLPALLGDELDIVTWVYAIKRFSAIRHYRISRAGELIAQVQMLGVWVELATGKPTRIPESFLSDFSANIAP